MASAAPAAAADIRPGDTITVGANETINDDLYAFGNAVTILGTVRGDVIAAGATVTIDGTVTGSVEAAGNSVTIRGPIGGSVRIAGNTLAIDGRVTGDVLAAGSSLTVGSSGRVGRDIVAATGVMTLVGETARDVRGSAGNLVIDGHVGRDVSVEVTTLRLTDRAAVDGSVSYGSATDAAVASGAKVSGRIERHAPQQRQPEAPTATSTIVDWLRNLVGVVVLGFIMLALVPVFMRRATDRLEVNPLASLGIGAGVLIGVPILAILVFIVGAIVGGWWIGLIAVALYLVACAVSLPIVSLATGEWILGRAGRAREPALALVIGAALILVLGVIPVVGGLIIFVAVLLGLGGIALSMGGPRERMAAAAR